MENWHSWKTHGISLQQFGRHPGYAVGLHILGCDRAKNLHMQNDYILFGFQNIKGR